MIYIHGDQTGLAPAYFFLPGLMLCEVKVCGFKLCTDYVVCWTVG